MSKCKLANYQSLKKYRLKLYEILHYILQTKMAKSRKLISNRFWNSLTDSKTIKHTPTQ